MALLATFSSCTEVDDRLGQNLLPDNQEMNIEIFTVDNPVDTYLYRQDSVPSSRMGKVVLGRMVDDKGIFGARTGSALLQFLPISKPYENAEGYGLDPVIDSMTILFDVTGVRGDTTLVQTFEVYDVLEGPEWLSRDSVYRANFPIEKYRGEKLFEFTHKGRGDVSSRLFPTAAGRAYMDSIVHLTWDAYTDDSLFTRKFHGLYITPSEGSPAAAAVWKADLGSSGMRMYVRNHDTLDVNAIYDTLTTLFSFNDTDVTDQSTGQTTYWDNVSIGMGRFDYTGSVLGELEGRTNGFRDTLSTSVPLSEVYVQGMGGVGTYLRFTDEFVDTMRGLGNGEQDIMVSQAMMRLQLPDKSTTVQNTSMTRLGSYMRYSYLSPVPDYQYYNEVSYQASTDATYKLPYGGYLNLSNGYYELDITSYVQRLAAGKIANAVFLGPEAYDVFTLNDSTIAGTGSDRPVTIRITYFTIER